VTLSGLRLFLALLWLVVAVYGFAVGFGGALGSYVPWLALLLALYDLGRWLTTREPGLPPPPPHRRRRPHDPPPQREYNPEFDFRLEQDKDRT
jgi:hypothetical protein